MKILYEDKETGISAGINDNGDLFIGDDSSGETMQDTPKNREILRRDFLMYTKSAHDC